MDIDRCFGFLCHMLPESPPVIPDRFFQCPINVEDISTSFAMKTVLSQQSSKRFLYTLLYLRISVMNAATYLSCRGNQKHMHLKDSWKWSCKRGAFRIPPASCELFSASFGVWSNFLQVERYFFSVETQFSSLRLKCVKPVTAVVVGVYSRLASKVTVLHESTTLALELVPRHLSL